MTHPRFWIGDKVFVASANFSPVEEQCPDCLGQKTIIVVLRDGTELTIGCERCKNGYSATGVVRERYRWFPCVTEITVNGVEVHPSGKVSYRYGECRSADGEHVFGTLREAEEAAAKISSDSQARDDMKSAEKLKRSRTWAWHVAYWRLEVSRLSHSLEVARKSLGVAGVKSGEAASGQKE